MNGLWRKKDKDGKRARPADWYAQWEQVMLENDERFRRKEPRIANLFAYHEKLKSRKILGIFPQLG